jgi:hypothetical protein
VKFNILYLSPILTETFNIADPYAGFLFKYPIIWETNIMGFMFQYRHILVSGIRAEYITFSLHTRVTKYFVVLKYTIALCNTPHFETLANKKHHITLHAFNLHSLSCPLCGTSVTVCSGEMKWQMVYKFTLSWIIFFSMAAGLPMRWWGWSKTQHFQLSISDGIEDFYTLPRPLLD